MNRRWLHYETLVAAVLACLVPCDFNCVALAASAVDSPQTDIRWSIPIPLRDGTRLDGTLYLPRNYHMEGPCLLSMTPYDAQTFHARGISFASHGFPFLAVDVRGRGNSQGEFSPFLQETHDAHDVVEWLAGQPYCHEKVATLGYSYSGYLQWAMTKDPPPHLVTMVPTAPAFPGRDFPMRSGIFDVWSLIWLLDTGGRTLKSDLTDDDAFWKDHILDWYRGGGSFSRFDSLLGAPLPTFQEWLAHPDFDEYWSAYNPSCTDYARMPIPILTVTGIYDGDQIGALQHYRRYMECASSEARQRMYLVIGPWDHQGTNNPHATIGGLQVGGAGQIDILKLHRDWFSWTARNGPKPDFLRAPVAYYVTGAEQWRYADSLDAITSESVALFLDSRANCGRLEAPCSLERKARSRSGRDRYRFDPAELEHAEYDGGNDQNYLVDQHSVLSLQGRELIYDTAPFDADTEVSGFFRLLAWLSIDRPDTDFLVSVYDVDPAGNTVLMTTDQLRARYRNGLSQQTLVRSSVPLAYWFGGFTFVSRLICKGNHLRLAVGPIDSLSLQRNFSAGRSVAHETLADARAVTVTLFHDGKHPSALYIPLGQPLPSADAAR